MADRGSGGLVVDSLRASTGSTSSTFLPSSTSIHGIANTGRRNKILELLLIWLIVRPTRQMIRCSDYHDVLRMPVLITRKMQHCTSWKKLLNMILSVNSWAPALYLTLATSDSHNQEALIRATEPNMLHVDYDIVLSPTYQVPALYFTLRWTTTRTRWLE